MYDFVLLFGLEGGIVEIFNYNNFLKKYLGWNQEDLFYYTCEKQNIIWITSLDE